LRRRGSIGALVTAVVVTVLAAASPARAEVTEVRLARQFGIASVPVMVMQHQKLLEKHLKAAGLPTTVEWKQFSGGSTMNDALLSGSLHIAAGGATPLLTIWDKTRGTTNEVKGVASLGSMPLLLITNNPKVKTLRDFTDKDKIAVPAVKVSIQAAFLQLASAKTFGEDQYMRLDPMTVSMPHPTAFAALMSGTEVTAHISSSPFVEQELQNPKNHVVLNSNDVLGPASTVALYTTTRFHDDNPKVYRAILAALREAMDIMQRDRKAAVHAYIEVEKSKLSEEFLLKAFGEPNVFTMTPHGFMTYGDFKHRTKTLKNRPSSWKDVFFSEIHDLPGN